MGSLAGSAAWGALYKNAHRSIVMPHDTPLATHQAIYELFTTFMQDLHLLSKRNHDDMWYLACPHLCTLDHSGYSQPPHINRFTTPQADFLDCDLSKLPEHKQRHDYEQPPPFDVQSTHLIHSHC